MFTMYKADNVYRQKFCGKSTPELEKTINNDNYGAFRIQCTLTDIPWRTIVNERSLRYLFERGAYKILAGLIRSGKEGRTTIDAERIVANTIVEFAEQHIGVDELEAVLTVFKEKNPSAARIVKKICRQIGFENFIYGNPMGWITPNYYTDPAKSTMSHSSNGYDFITIDDTVKGFESLFPGEDVIPKRIGSWTDERDGEVYRTVRVQNVEWLATSLKYGMDEDGFISQEDFNDRFESIIPNGWRLPTHEEASRIWPMKVTRWGGALSTAVLLDKNAGWIVNSSDFAIREVSREEEIGASGFALRPTHVGKNRMSTVCTFFISSPALIKNPNGIDRRCFNLAGDEPERLDGRWKEENIHGRTCVLLCRTVYPMNE